MKNLKSLSAPFSRALFFTITVCSIGSCSTENAEPQKQSYAPSPIDVPLEGRSDQVDSLSFNGKLEEPKANGKQQMISSFAARTNKNQNRLFVRTANLRFRVNEVAGASYAIEDLIAKLDGHVTYTHLNSQIDYVQNIDVRKDSTLEMLHYTVQNNISIRIPDYHLDSALKGLVPLVDYLDYRTIRAEDVTHRYRTNRKEVKRLQKHTKRLEKAIDEKGSKLKQTVRTEDKLLEQRARMDNVAEANERLEDQIAYSTIVINIYQRQGIKKTLMANEKSVESFEPGLAAKLWESLHFGWSIVEGILLFVTRFWSMILLVLALTYTFRKLIFKANKAA